MKLFLKNILLFLIPLLLISFLVELFITYQLNSGKRYYFQADWHDLDDHNSDVLFIGNSRTYVHINPFTVNETFNIQSEVIGQNGQSVHVLWLKFKEYCKSNATPKEIYLQFDPFFLNQKKDLYGYNDFQTCFFMNRIDLTSLNEHEGYKFYYHFLPLTALRGEFFIKVLINETIPPEISFQASRGFQAEDEVWKGDWANPESIHIDTTNFSNYTDSFFVYSKIHNIKLYAVFPPMTYPAYKNISGTESLKEYLNKLNEIYQLNVPLLNFNNNKFIDSTLFYNHIHLNKQGVEVFMHDFIKDEMSFDTFKNKSKPEANKRYSTLPHSGPQ